MSTQKAIAGLHRKARELVGRDITVKMEVGESKSFVTKVEDVKFNRKPKIDGNTVALQVRLRFANMRYSDITFKTEIPT